MSTPRRASDAKSAFARAGLGSGPATRPATRSTTEQSKDPNDTVTNAPNQMPAPTNGPAVPVVPAQDKPKPTKYTLLLDQDEALAFDQLALKLRTKTGRKIDKSLIVKALLDLAGDDPTVLDSLITEIQGRTRP